MRPCLTPPILLVVSSGVAALALDRAEFPNDGVYDYERLREEAR